MSEDFSEQNNAEHNHRTDDSTSYFQDFTESFNEINLPYDHIYATNSDAGDEEETVTLPDDDDNNCQTAESEVKFLKEWLILHLDLIQQQNDEILSKEQTILILQKENEMLKERISCMDRGAHFEPSKYFENHLENYEQEMTQDCAQTDSENSKTNCVTGNLLDDLNGSGGVEILKKFDKQLNHNHQHLSDSEHFNHHHHKVENNFVETSTPIKNNNLNNKVNDCVVSDYSFTINRSDLDSMRNLRMSIRRKRCSNSSNNEFFTEEKRSYRKFRKKRKKVIKDSQILTTEQPYITITDEVFKEQPPDVEMLTNTTLEVPRWRVKVYASCYTMEGTENLDDEVFNKRHSRLEHDERRRKRWDVQRIREQRVIEKLKQRQERAASGSRGDNKNARIQSLWPKLEDIKYLEICDQLPVVAFGCPIPKINPSEFSLPWLSSSSNASHLTIKKVPGKRSTVKKKNAKR